MTREVFPPPTETGERISFGAQKKIGHPKGGTFFEGGGLYLGKGFLRDHSLIVVGQLSSRPATIFAEGEVQIQVTFRGNNRFASKSRSYTHAQFYGH